VIGSRFYVNPDPDPHKSILVAGTARSGTTWLGDLIASQISCRILFEPFHPKLVPDYRSFNYFQYMRPGSIGTELLAVAQRVFSGEIRNRWIDRQNERIFPEYRLIKEIRANLFLKWLHDNIPEVPIVYLMRHPCAVVLSRMELDWSTDSDIEPFLTQPDLVDDHLTDHLDLIRKAKTDEEKHAIIWSVSNLVPLRQFKPGELKIIFYENLCIQPEIELSDIFASIGQKFESPIIDKINRPSQTTRETSAVVTETDKITNWKKNLSPSQIDNIFQVVEAFGLGNLYGDSILPLNSGLANHVIS
jgi:hypothetical protein